MDLKRVQKNIAERQRSFFCSHELRHISVMLPRTAADREVKLPQIVRGLVNLRIDGVIYLCLRMQKNHADELQRDTKDLKSVQRTSQEGRGAFLFT